MSPPADAPRDPAVEPREAPASPREAPAAPPPAAAAPAPLLADAPRAARARRLRDTGVLVLVALAAFATGVALFNGLLMPQLIHGTGEVQVPDLANLTAIQAEAVLRGVGLRLERVGERYDPSVPRGFILTQDPPAGTPVRGRRRVMVSVSLGQEFSSVPELFGETRRGAQLLLEHAGLRLGGITLAPNDEVGDGLVVATDPAAESVLPRGTPVALLVSIGSGTPEFVMPDLTGREVGNVRRQLEALGFKVLLPPAAPSVGPVVSQSPPPGARVTRDAVVVLQATGRVIR